MPKSKAPLRKPDVDLNKLDKFATQADKPKKIVKVKEKPKYPWEGPKVKSDRLSGMGVPLTEPYLLKLRFIAQHTKWSQRKFCQERLQAAIDREVAVVIKQLGYDTD